MHKISGCPKAGCRSLHPGLLIGVGNSGVRSVKSPVGPGRSRRLSVAATFIHLLIRDGAHRRARQASEGLYRGCPRPCAFRGSPPGGVLREGCSMNSQGQTEGREGRPCCSRLEPGAGRTGDPWTSRGQEAAQHGEASLPSLLHLAPGERGGVVGPRYLVRDSTIPATQRGTNAANSTGFPRFLASSQDPAGWHHLALLPPISLSLTSPWLPLSLQFSTTLGPRRGGVGTAGLMLQGSPNFRSSSLKGTFLGAWDQGAEVPFKWDILGHPDASRSLGCHRREPGKQVAPTGQRQLQEQC